MKKFFSFLLLLFLSLNVSISRECLTIKDWEGYFAERLDILDPIEGIYDIQVKFGRDGAPSGSANAKFAIARVSGNLFELYLIGGNNMNAFFERVGNTNYYYIHEYNLSFKERFLLEDNGTFLIQHLESHTYTSIGYDFYDRLIIQSRDVIKEQTFSGIKIFPDKTTVQKALSVPIWSGSGFALGNGYVVTNHHVAGNAKLIQVYDTSNKKVYSAKLVASDYINDLAVIKVDDQEFNGYYQIPFSIDTGIKEVASKCFVLGYPQWAELGTEIKYSDGTISAWSGFKGNVSTYQISAPVSHGSSGGPTFDSSGNVIGIIRSGVPIIDDVPVDNVNYAIKVSYLVELLSSKALLDSFQWKNTIATLSLTEKVSAIKPFVYLLLCTSSNSWEDGVQAASDSPYEYELPKRKVKVKKVSQKEINKQRIAAVENAPDHLIGKIDDEDWKRIKISLKADNYVCKLYNSTESELSKRFLPLFIEAFNTRVQKSGVLMTTEKNGFTDVSAVLEVLLVDTNDGETYSIVSFYQDDYRVAQVYINGDGGKGNSLIEKSEKSMRQSAIQLAKHF